MGKITKCIIPAAGFGTRLLPATKSQPKEMVPIGRKPVIQYVVEEAVNAGIEDILIITGGRKRAIEDHFDRDSLLEEMLRRKNDQNGLEVINLPDKLGVRIFYTRQAEPTGLADAVLLGEAFAHGEPFAVSLGDTIIQSDDETGFLSKLIESHEAWNSSATIGLEEVVKEDVCRFGIVKPGRVEGLEVDIVGLVEKPEIDDAPSRFAVASRYVFEAEIFESIRRTRTGVGGEKQLTDAIEGLIESGKLVKGLKLDLGEKRHDIGDPSSYAIAFIELCLQDPEIAASIRSHFPGLSDL